MKADLLLNNFSKNLPPSLTSIVRELHAMGISVGFIGGFVRDYCLSQKFSNDVDLELRANHSLSMQELQEIFGGKLNTEFMILSFKREDYSLELSWPRIERFRAQEKGHKNFDIEFTKDYQQAFLRRDFTINAIMFEFYAKKWRLVDPLGGLKDLKSGILRNCSSSFYKDPVRKLRALRFKLNLGFEYAPELVAQLDRMQVSDSSVYYIFQEANKCVRPMNFLHQLAIIDNCDFASPFNNKGRLQEALLNDLTIENRKEVLNFFKMKTSSLFNPKCISSKLKDNQKLIEFFIKEETPLSEVRRVLKYYQVDYEDFDLKIFLDQNLRPVLDKVPAKDRSSYVFNERLKKAKK